MKNVMILIKIQVMDATIDVRLSLIAYVLDLQALVLVIAGMDLLRVLRHVIRVKIQDVPPIVEGLSLVGIVWDLLHLFVNINVEMGLKQSMKIVMMEI